jgi:uncharacterized membrane protein
MNDAGELNFYRYDLQEKTLQRYFEDPVAEELKMRAEKYPEVVERYDKLVGQYNSMFILACVLGGIVIALLIFMIVVLTQKRHMPQNDTLGSMKDPKVVYFEGVCKGGKASEAFAMKADASDCEIVFPVGAVGGLNLTFENITLYKNAG